MDPTQRPGAFGNEILLRLHGAEFSVLLTADADPNARYVHIEGRYVSLGYSAISQQADTPDSPVDEELSLFFGHDMKSEKSITAHFSGSVARVIRGFLPPSVLETFARYEHLATYPTREIVDVMVSYFLAHEQPPGSTQPPSGSTPRLEMRLDR